MPKLVFLLLLALLMVVSPDMSEAATPAASAEAATLGPPKVHRPNYKRYRGNSRSKKRRRGLFKRWAARRKAKRQQKAAPPRRGVIRVDAPDVKMPPKPQP